MCSIRSGETRAASRSLTSANFRFHRAGMSRKRPGLLPKPKSLQKSQLVKTWFQQNQQCGALQFVTIPPQILEIGFGQQPATFLKRRDPPLSGIVARSMESRSREGCRVLKTSNRLLKGPRRGLAERVIFGTCLSGTLPPSAADRIWLIASHLDRTRSRSRRRSSWRVNLRKKTATRSTSLTIRLGSTPPASSSVWTRARMISAGPIVAPVADRISSPRRSRRFVGSLRRSQ
jgi:hypothetical protein